MRRWSSCRIVLEWRAAALVCAHIMVKNVFVIPKSSLGSFAICFFPPSVSILPHTFEPLCGIVPWCWLGSLLPRPLLPPWPAALAPPPPPHQHLPFTPHDHILPAGARHRGEVLRILRSKTSRTGGIIPSMRTEGHNRFRLTLVVSTSLPNPLNCGCL